MVTKDKYIQILKFSSGIIFITLGLLFAISGLATNMRLKRYFGDFYKEHKCMLVFATMGLSVPLIFRGTLDLLRYYDKDIEKLIHDEPALYSSMLLVVGDMIPLAF